MSPEWLVLELTQSGILANTGQDLKALSAMGVRIAERVETGRELLSSPLSRRGSGIVPEEPRPRPGGFIRVDSCRALRSIRRLYCKTHYSRE